MERVLIVGENPYNGSGNGNMVASMLGKLNREKYDVTLFLMDRINFDLVGSPQHLIEFPVITSNEDRDIWGLNKLLQVLNRFAFDAVLFIGIDIWRYAPIFDSISSLQVSKGFRWYFLFPYDLPYVREDWLNLIKQVQYPFVYSEFGYDLLKPYVPNIQFFRPEPFLYPIFQHDPNKLLIRNRLFSGYLKEDTILFTFIGNNQMRKNIGNLIKGFSLHLKEYPNSCLYMHTEENGIWNIKKLKEDYKIGRHNLFLKPPNYKSNHDEMPFIYNMSDCIINPSIQEGLSWTVIESLMCGVPIIVSDSTAHKDYYNYNETSDHDFIITVQPTAPTFLNLMAGGSPSFIEANKSVEPESIAEGMKAYVEYIHGKDISNSLQNTAARWLNKCSSINKILDYKETVKKEIGELI